MRTRDAHILIVPGLGDSGTDHWQSRWQAKLPTARRVIMPSWDKPDPAAWTAAVREAIAADESRPVVIVAHSLGVIATARALLAAGAPPVAGAFLVSPPSEEAVKAIDAIDASFVPFPRSRLPCPAVLVGSRTDPPRPARLCRDPGARLGGDLYRRGRSRPPQRRLRSRPMAGGA